MSQKPSFYHLRGWGEQMFIVGNDNNSNFYGYRPPTIPLIVPITYIFGTDEALKRK